MTRNDVLALAARVEAATKGNNAMDVLVEIALFKPTTTWQSVRANAAGTKAIYTDINGREATFWATDWTGPKHKVDTASALRALAQETPE